ncbi:MAG TPA: NUDIX domain-containing protein [Allosphingosinicella sp.]|jgi:ADP-ribose pyrophosphatase YjhB (NUDIX family)
MRAAMQIGYRIRRLLHRGLRIRTRGVKVMVFNAAGELLLVRNSYGQRHLFVLPGGGVGRRESEETAAAREVREELGIEAGPLVLVSVHASTGEGKRDTVHLFRAVTDATPVADGVEVEEARFFPLDALPERLSAATARRIEELRGTRPRDGGW